ncbi:aspartyl protease family protein 1-like [Telopea speciosissima]|uniref:aspartyl protease family protein 1-like n=1 Tax=Telopea speciosissima TaxID=54955 RepID=UPI001CC6C1C6|nr:aspartyl protease family protein 1-like [Telopea speciosissima]
MTNWGYLHYTIVSVGTPSISFFVALDTGSDLFWLPCNCYTACTSTSQSTNYGVVVNLNYYSPNASSTSKNVPCNSNMCEQQGQCLDPNSCPYQLIYVDQSSTSGYLVEDVLHLKTDNTHQEVVDAHITFGCSQTQTGGFLFGGPTDGLFGLGLDKLSVPSILSSAGLTANSFSMCFGSDGIGRINFGDKGSPDQGETPFIPNQLNPTYIVSVTQITVGRNLMNISFTAIFDSGTSATYLNDPAYTHLTKSFNAQVQDKLLPYDPNNGFEYCYDTSSTSSYSTIPTLSLTMGSGSQFLVSNPIFGVMRYCFYSLLLFDPTSSYCLGIFKNTGSNDLNTIGQNFMSNYLIVFDRERSVLGWKESDCYGSKVSSTTKTQPSSTATPPSATPSSSTATPPPATPSSSTTIPPATPTTTVVPGNVSPATTTTSGGYVFSSGAPTASVQWSQCWIPINYRFLILFLVFFTII